MPAAPYWSYTEALNSARPKQALRWAARLATSVGAHLDAVGAWDLPTSAGWVTVYPEWDPAQDMMEVLTATVADVFGGNRPAELALASHQGGAAGVLLDQAAGALMLVVGSRGHGGFAGLLLGSVSASVAEHARCPVLVVHGDAEPPDFRPM
jgi:nucleotide-binding universal stress UspA family protein